jgi:Alpha/beta hydrolase family
MRPKAPAAGMRLSARAPAATLLFVVVAAGCAQTTWVKVREVPENPLAGPLQLLSPGGPKPTPRTALVLRRYNLEEDVGHHDAKLLANLVEIAHAEPSADKLYSLSELAYLAGKRAEPISRRKALDYHGLAVVNAYQYLFDERFGRYRNPYDPGFRGACDLYNEALESAIRIIKKQGKLVPGSTQTIQTASQTVETTIVLCSRSWRAEDFADFRFVSDYEIRGLQNEYHTYGLGVPLIAERKRHDTASPEEKYYPPGMSFPVTAFLRVMPGGNQAEGHFVVHLELYDPLNTSEISVDGRRVPLESDLTTPLAYALNQKELQDLESSTAGLLNPAKAAKLQGLYMLEPYQPGKIPVLMIHGLWSSPITWMEMFNDLRGSPEIRSRYQFWFYLYPTGQAFWHSAAQLRRDLAEAREIVDPAHRQRELDQMVLVGHSMGGLVARLQEIDSGNDFWNIVSDKPFDVVKASYETRQDLADTFFFHPQRSVRRVITIGTPFRGSEFANSTTRWIGSKLIRIPQMLVRGRQELYTQNPGLFRKNNLIDGDTSIDSLAPDSPILPVMAGARAAPWVRQHNIVGRTSKKSLLGRVTGDGDGVVSYESAHLEGAASEVVIDADHLNIHRHPLAVLEVHRLLLTHLAEIDAGAPRRLERLPWTASAANRSTAPITHPAGSPSARQEMQPAGPPLP